MSLTQLQIVEAAGIGLTSLLRTQYDREVPDVLYRHGNPILQRIKPGRIVPSTGANGGEGGWEFQMRTGFADSARSTLDASRDFRTPRKSSADKLRVRFSIDNPANNDINRIDTGARLHVADLKRAAQNPGVAVDIVKNVVTDATEGINATAEILMHSDKTGQIGAINGTPKAIGTTDYAAAAAYSSGATSARIKVDEYSFAIFKREMHLDFYTSAGVLQADAIKVIDVNEADFSIGLQTTDDTTVADLDLLSDGDYIFRAGERNAGFKAGFGEIFKTSYANDSWFGGKDRSAAGNGHYIPVRTRVTGVSTENVSNRIVDKLFRSLAYRQGSLETKMRPTLVMGAEMVDNWRYDVADATVVNRNTVDAGKLQTGEDGISYVHPAVGRVDVVATLTARNDRLYVIYPEDWEMLYGDFKGLEYLSGTSGNVWERVPGTGTEGGGSVFYRMEALTYMTPFCSRPNKQAVAFSLR